ncbi:MAG: hypothetical protein ACFCGT_20630 [Sandaracinaceae bacterium]
MTHATAWSANPGQAITVVSLSARSFEPLSRLAQSPAIHAINIDMSPPPELH